MSEERSTHHIASELLALAGKDNSSYFFESSKGTVCVADMHDYPTDDFIYISFSNPVDYWVLVVHVTGDRDGDVFASDHPPIIPPEQMQEFFRDTMLSEIERLNTL